MIFFPVVATAISAVFSAALLRRYRSAGRIQSLAWGVSMAMFAVASLILVLADVYGWGGNLYRAFWLFGALLNVPWLATGSIALAFPKLGKVALVSVLVLSVYAFIATMLADPIASTLANSTGIPRGKDTWPVDSNMLGLVRTTSLGGWLIVVGLAAWTSRERKGLKPSRDRLQANTLISIGVSVIAIGGFALGRFGGTAAFSTTLALGVAVMYAGFRLASRAPRFEVTNPGEQAT